MPLRTVISTIMTRAPATVPSDATLLCVQRVLARHACHHVLVVERGKLAGLVSANDLQRFAPAEGCGSEEIEAEFANVAVKDAMTTDLVTITSEEPIARAADLLGVGSFHCLPVVSSEGELLGIVTTADVIRFLSAHPDRRLTSFRGT